MTTAAVQVRKAKAGDLTYVDALRRREAEALGFLPAVVYQRAALGTGPRWTAQDRLWIAAVSGDPVGFLYLTPGLPGGTARVIQVCVQGDARRREYAAALVAQAERYATGCQRGALSARIAADLEAGLFWEAIGYPLIRTEDGGARRGRVLEFRRKSLPIALTEAD